MNEYRERVEKMVIRDAPLEIWGDRVFVAYKLFFYFREKTIFFLVINVRQFFFKVSSKSFLSYAFAIMYVIIWCFFLVNIFSSILTTNFFFCPHFQQTFFSGFCGDKLFFSSPPPPPQISNGASLIIIMLRGVIPHQLK